MPPKKTPVKAPVSTPQTKKKIVGSKARKPRNSITAKTPKPPIVKDGTPKKPLKTSAKAKGGRASGTKIIIPDIQEMKIKLANEVVQAQFPKQHKFQNLTVKPIKKPVLKRKRVQNVKNHVNLVTEETQETIDTVTPEDEKPVAKKRPRIVRKNVQADATVNGTEKPSSQNKLKTTPRRNLSLHCKKIFHGLERTILNDYVPETIRKDNNNKKSDVLHSEINKYTCEINKNTTEPSFINTGNDNQAVYSRRSSDIGSDLSWTKDLSSSSTTTCVTVTSNDFVCIDNKLPFVRLTKYDIGISNGNNDKVQTSSSDTSSTSSSSTDKENTEYEVSTNNTINLSISTSSSEKYSVIKSSIFDKLLEVLKSFDPEQLNWTSCDNECANTDKFKAKLEKENVFQDETALITQWLEIRSLESERNLNDTLIGEIVNCDTSAAESCIEVTDDSYSAKNEEKESKKRTDEDDDDALSLFAESISGFDISRRSSSFVTTEPPKSHAEEYVPQPLVSEVFKVPQVITYNPSKISDLGQISNRLSVCEKQNADSTSIRNEINEINPDVSVNNFETSSDSSKSESEVLTNISRNQISLLSCKPIQFVKSTVLRGVCAFNIIDYCRKVQCNFPHTYPDPMLVQMRLKRLSDKTFIQEYLFIRSVAPLRSVYGLFFIDECVRRQLARVLVQISIDFVVKATEGSATDEKLKTEAVERTLLYFNFQDLVEYEDLMKFEIRDGLLLCDVFLQVMGQSQNFSRFRTVFINLTMLMCRLGRVFDSDVACQVLERVCILPYEFSLNRTLIEILKKTDGKVFSNSMSGNLEKRLLATNKHLYDEFIKVKKLVCHESGEFSVDKDLRYSPDTTNYESMVEIGLPLVSQAPCFNRYNKKPFKTRWNQQMHASNGIFNQKPMFRRPLNSLFASPIFSPSQNPGHILSNLNKKL